MKNYFYSILIACVFLAISFQSSASHMVGSDISYSCTSTPGIWHVKIAIYRDCSGIPTGNCTGGCGTGCSYTLNWASTDPSCNYSGSFSVSLTSVTDVNPNPLCPSAKSICTNMGCETAGIFTPGIEKYVFEGNVNLGSSVLSATCCNVRIYWQECCRNSAITSGAAGNNFYIEAIINRCAAANNPCNNSPELSNDPFAVICGGQSFVFNNGAIDPDHDSLTFAFAPALTAAGISVTYNPPYTYDAPMPHYLNQNPFPLGISCDANSGDIMFTPNYGAGGQFVGVMAIEIKQWRNINGMPICIGITRRDMQMWLITCPPNNPPRIMTDPSNGIQPKLSWQVCAGDQICFYVIGKDTDYLPNNTPPISDTTYITWNASLASKGATFLPTYNPANRKVTGPREDKYQFCWHPTEADASNIPYYFTVKAKDYRCPYAGQVTRAISILVIGHADVSIIKHDSGCGKWLLSYVNNKPSQTLISTVWNISRVPNDYSLTNVNTYLNVVAPPLQNFTLGGKYLVQLALNTAGASGGSLCYTQFFDTLVVDTFLFPTVRDTFSCNGNPVTIRPTLNQYGNRAPYHYKWYDASQSSIILSITDSLIIIPSSTKTYNVDMTDSLNCATTKSINVHGKPATLPISGNISSNKNSYQSYFVTYTSGSAYNWFITNGSETSGGNSNRIIVKWGNQNTGKVAVQESNLYCLGDTVSLNISLTNTGINENKVFNNFSVFPNPTSGLLNIEFETSEKNIDLEVLDILGRSVLKTTAKHNGGLFQNTIDLSELISGIYFLKITAGEKSMTVKVTLN